MNSFTFIDHLKRLTSFSGRENLRSFWVYAAIIVGLTMALFMASFVPILNKAFATAQQFAIEHPDQVTIQQGVGQTSISMHGPGMPSLFSARDLLLLLGIFFGLNVILLAAAVARRLHDTGRSGWWGLMPMPFIAYSTVMMPQMFAKATQQEGSGFPMGLFFSVFFSNMLYIVALITLIVLLTGKSQTHENRYGSAA